MQIGSILTELRGKICSQVMKQTIVILCDVGHELYYYLAGMNTPNTDFSLKVLFISVYHTFLKYVYLLNGIKADVNTIIISISNKHFSLFSSKSFEVL